MSPTIFQRVQGIAADVFLVSPEQITAQSSPQDLENWDSVQHLNLILALEQQFAVQFDPEEMDQLHTIGQIAAQVESKLNRVPRP